MPRHDYNRSDREQEPEPLLGALAGLVGGLVASGAMNAFQAAWQAAARSDPSGGGEPSTVKAAERLAGTIDEAPIPKESKSSAGNAVHYAFGAALGAAYGFGAEYVPQLKLGSGTAFGLGSMLLFDDAVVPAAGLSEPATKTSLGTHAYSAASHLVYGATLESVRVLIRSAT